MTDAELDGLLDRVDAAVGRREAETPEERAVRRAELRREARARRIRLAARPA